MVTVDKWTAVEAAMLQDARRETNRQFARTLGIDPRTVPKWRDKARRNIASVCTPEMQQILDEALANACTPEQRKAFQARLAARGGKSASLIGLASPAPCTVVSHKFLPVYLGEDSSRLEAETTPTSGGPGGLEVRSLPVDHDTAQMARLHLYDCGVGVIHIEECRDVDSLTDLAVWRYRTYLVDRAWAGKVLAGLLPERSPAGLVPEYVLSAYELRDHSWAELGLETALQLLTTPSVLVDRQDPDNVVPLESDVEATRFAEAWSQPEAVPFTGGTSLGIAGWSGVSYCPQPDERALNMGDIVALELDAQALWALSSHILREMEEGRDPVMPEKFGWRYLRGAHSRLTAARPTETAQHRMMREAILSTSTLPGLLQSAQSALRDSN